MNKILITLSELRTLIREMHDAHEQLKCGVCNMPNETCECGVDEVAPPGQEKQIMGIKKAIKRGDIPKTYVDKSGKRQKTNPWKIAWSQHEKE